VAHARVDRGGGRGGGQANEDHNCYTFDMRKLDRALNVLKDHVSAVYERLATLGK